jgi:hypothetical protein
LAQQPTAYDECKKGLPAMSGLKHPHKRPWKQATADKPPSAFSEQRKMGVIHALNSKRAQSSMEPRRRTLKPVISSRKSDAFLLKRAAFKQYISLLEIRFCDSFMHSHHSVHTDDIVVIVIQPLKVALHTFRLSHANRFHDLLELFHIQMDVALVVHGKCKQVQTLIVQVFRQNSS